MYIYFHKFAFYCDNYLHPTVTILRMWGVGRDAVTQIHLNNLNIYLINW